MQYSKITVISLSIIAAASTIYATLCIKETVRVKPVVDFTLRPAQIDSSGYNKTVVAVTDLNAGLNNLDDLPAYLASAAKPGRAFEFPNIRYAAGDTDIPYLATGAIPRAAGALRARPEAKVMVVACSDVWNSEDADPVGLQRARMVVRRMIELGVEPRRLAIADSAQTDRNRAECDRTQLVLIVTDLISSSTSKLRPGALR